LGFGLVSVRDTLIAGNTFGQLEELPPFPNKFPPIVTKKIALFHGSIINSTLQNYTSLTKGYPLDWFKGYDLLLLGDIHLQQIHGTDKYGNWNKDLVWGYPGSLIQQNFGEHLFEHGYFIWDLENKTTKAYNIKPSFGFLTVKYEDEWKVKIGKDLVLLQEANIPDNINIRISGKTKEVDIEKLKNQLDGKKYNISSSILNVEDKQEKLVDVNEIATCNSSDSWINYIEKYHLVSELEKYNWKSWFRTPETFNIDLSIIDASIIDSLDKRNEAIIKKAKSYLDAKMSHDMNSKKTYFYLSHMKWSWLLSYQKDNWFDFSKVDGKIATLNAPNGSGKSSFLEIICLGVFGKSPPSRINSDDPTSIINCYKPYNEKACVEVVLNINQNKYLIRRTYNVTNKMKEEVVLYENDVEINSGHKAVDEWVSINIGKFDSFLLTSMLTQNSDKDFFSLNKKDQIDLFNKALNVDSITALEALMKETMLAHTYLITKMEGIYASLEEILIPESSSLDNDYKISEIKTKLVDIESKKKVLIKPNVKNYSIVELLELKKRNLKEERNLDSLIEFRGTIKNQIDRLGIYPSFKGDKIEEMIDISTIVTRDIDEIEKEILLVGDCLHSKSEIEEKIKEYKDISKPEYQIEDYEKWEKEKNSILKEVEVVGIEALKKFLEENPVMVSPLTKEELDKRIARLDKERIVCEEVSDVRDIEKKKREEYEDLLKISILDIEKPTISREELLLKIDNSLEDNLSCSLSKEEIDKRRLRLEKERIVCEEVPDVRDIEKKKREEYEDLLKIAILDIGKPTISREELLLTIDKYRRWLPLVSKWKKQILLEKEKLDIERRLEKLKASFKYNPDCWACKEQPLRKQILEEEKRLKEIEEEEKIESYLEEFEKIDISHTKHLLKQWDDYDDYNKKKDLVLKRDVLKEELVSLKEQSDRRIKYEYYLANKDRWEEEESFLKKMDNNYIKSLLKQWDDYIQKKEITLKRDLLKEELISLKEQLDRRVNYEYYLANKDRWEEEELFLEKIEKMIESYPISKKSEDLLKRYDNINEEVWLIRLEKIKRYQNKIYWENQIKRSELEVERNNFYRKVGISKYFKEQLDGQLVEVEEKIENGKMFLKLKDFQMMEKFLIEEKEQLSLRKEELSERKFLSELEKVGERIKMIEKNIIDQKIRKNEIALKIDSLNERNEVLKYLKDTCVKGYRSYLYNDIVLPKLLSITNNIVSDAVENNNTMLTANYDEGRLIFGIKRYEEESITIEKCGGFHRFIYGLGMRIALNSMGASGVLCSQLFLDEGFVSADSDNLSRIPNFLRKLIGVYKGILVVSHLEILKECGDIQANIRKGYLRF